MSKDILKSISVNNGPWDYLKRSKTGKGKGKGNEKEKGKGKRKGKEERWGRS